MATIKVSSQIAAPVERVFQVFTDLEHGAEHVSGIKNVSVLTIGPFSLGTRWQETRDLLGRLDDAEMEVTSFELNRSYTVTHQKAGARIDATFTFEPLDGGTAASIQFDLSGPGLPPGLLSPLEWALSGRVRDVLSRDLADLKAAIDKVAH